MTPDPHITARNDRARLVMTDGTRVVLRSVLFGEQVRLSGGRFASEVTPMMHGRFRLIQDKGGVRAPIDIAAQNVDRIARRGATGGLGWMPKPLPADAGVFQVSYMRMPFTGTMEMFLGRAAVHGVDEATGADRVVLLSDVQIMEVTLRKLPPRVRAETDDYVPAEAAPDGPGDPDVEGGAGDAAADGIRVPAAEASEEPGESPNT